MRKFSQKLLVNTHSSKVLFINASSISVKSFNLFLPPTECSFSFIAQEPEGKESGASSFQRQLVVPWLIVWNWFFFALLYFSEEFFFVKGVSEKWGNFNDLKLVGDLLFDDDAGRCDWLPVVLLIFQQHVYDEGMNNYDGVDSTKAFANRTA